MKPEESGGRIFDYFCALSPNKQVTRSQVCFECDITPSQWGRGRAYLRDLFGTDQLIHVRDRSRVLYQLASYSIERDAREYQERILRGKITNQTREYAVFQAIYEAHPTAENERQAAFAKLRLSQLRTAHRQLLSGGQMEIDDEDAA